MPFSLSKKCLYERTQRLYSQRQTISCVQTQKNNLSFGTSTKKFLFAITICKTESSLFIKHGNYMFYALVYVDDLAMQEAQSP